MKKVRMLENKYQEQTGYIVGRGPSLLWVGKGDFGPGPVIVINEAIQKIQGLRLDNDIYSQWRNGDVLPDLPNYLMPWQSMLLCVDPVKDERVPGGILPPSSDFFPEFRNRYLFDCRQDLRCDPNAAFSHRAAVEIAVNIFGCNRLVMVGFDSYRDDFRTVLKNDFVQSEYRPGDYRDQTEIIKNRVKELNVECLWFFPTER